MARGETVEPTADHLTSADWSAGARFESASLRARRRCNAPPGVIDRRSVDVDHNAVFLPVVCEREDFVGDFVTVERDAADVLSGEGVVQSDVIEGFAIA